MAAFFGENLKNHNKLIESYIYPILRYKDGLRLKPSLQFQINSTGSLRILDINKDHTGVYRCFVNNLHTKAKLMRSYSIQVACKSFYQILCDLSLHIAINLNSIFGRSHVKVHFYSLSDNKDCKVIAFPPTMLETEKIYRYMAKDLA